MDHSPKEEHTGKYEKSGMGTVQPFRFVGDDEALIEALKSGHVGAATVLYERYSVHVRKVLVRIMGMDQELPDLINEVFFQALKSVDNINDGSRLKAWLTRIAVYVARGCIRKRSRKRWLFFSEDVESDALYHYSDKDESRAEMARAIRNIINSMPVDERIVFSLRFVEGMEIVELAEACEVSKATIKRRLAKCERRFKALASGHEGLRAMLESSPKWRKR